MIAAFCLPFTGARVSARVQPEVGRAVDVSAFSDLDIIHALHIAQAQEPELMREASSDVPPGAAYALLERFLQIFEGTRGKPFTLTGGK